MQNFPGRRARAVRLGAAGDPRVRARGLRRCTSATTRSRTLFHFGGLRQRVQLGHPRADRLHPRQLRQPLRRRDRRHRQRPAAQGATRRLPRLRRRQCVRRRRAGRGADRQGQLRRCRPGAATSTSILPRCCPTTPASTSPSRRATGTTRCCSTTRSRAASSASARSASSDQLKLVFSGRQRRRRGDRGRRNQVETTPVFLTASTWSIASSSAPWEFLVTPSLRAGFTRARRSSACSTSRSTPTTPRRPRRAQPPDHQADPLAGRHRASHDRVRHRRDRARPGSTAATRSTPQRSRAPCFRGAAVLHRRRSRVTDRCCCTRACASSGSPRHRPRRRRSAPALRSGSSTDKTALKGGVGLYSQGIQQPVQLDEVFGNPRLGLATLGAHQLGRRRRSCRGTSFIEVTGFYKELWNLVAPSTARWSRGPTADPRPRDLRQHRDRARLRPRAAACARTSATTCLRLGLATRSSRSTRIAAPGAAQRLFDFDQTHILTLIASYKFPRGWQIGARFRLVSGNPYTAGQRTACSTRSSAATCPIRGRSTAAGCRRSTSSTCASTRPGSCRRAGDAATSTCRTSTTSKTSSSSTTAYDYPETSLRSTLCRSSPRSASASSCDASIAAVDGSLIAARRRLL